MIKDLFSLAEQRKKQLVQGTVLYVIAAFFAAIPYFFLYLIFKELLNSSLSFEQTAIFSSAVAFCLLLQGIFLYWANSINYATSYRFVGDLRLRLGDRIRKLPMGFFVQKQVGDLNTIVGQDMQNIEAIPAQVYPKIIAAIALPTFIATLLLFIDWRMTLATFTGVPFCLLIFIKSKQVIQTVTETHKSSQVEANSRIIEYIQGLSAIKAFNQTGAKFNKLQTALSGYKEANLSLIGQLTVAIVAFAGVLDLSFAIILLVGIYLLSNSQLDTATFLLFLVLGLRFWQPLYEFLEFLTLVGSMNAAIKRVSSILKTPLLPEPTKEVQAIDSFDLEFCNVSFGYDEVKILNNISFKIPEKTITALVGSSGAGKTTIINLISRFWDVSAGEVLIGGVNVKNLTSNQLIVNISTVFQDVYLFNDTIANNIKLGNKQANEEQIIAAAKAARCHQFIEQLPNGYETKVGEGGAMLSGGEKQRISIARAILKDAPIILLDEATASVDPENQLLIQQAIDALVSSKTLIIIAHQLSTIVSADQILVIDSTQIIERGKHQQLLEGNGLYAKLWREQKKSNRWKLQPKSSLVNYRA
ncbi:MAG: ABC transporter ATP-binding protein [Pleurocapsa sp. CRU_1_2]|nr:ABC transporter ATP-binding protein [Pleurocapsa sp. CRU_1_2]